MPIGTTTAPYLDYLKGHSTFFILLTVVFGAITGVGIWWTIGLASPLATETLIRTFVFGWAMEYVAFVVELAAAFIFYYYWNRLSPPIHTQIGWIYAWAAWISLVLITGITAFMLDPGEWSPTHNNFWAALFNPQCIPQIIARTGGALLLTSLYVYFHSSLFVAEQRLRDLIQKRSSRPALLGAVMILCGGVGWFYFLPESARAVLEAAAAINLLTALIFILTILVLVLVYLGPYRNPGWLTPGFAAALWRWVSPLSAAASSSANRSASPTSFTTWSSATRSSPARSNSSGKAATSRAEPGPSRTSPQSIRW